MRNGDFRFRNLAQMIQENYARHQKNGKPISYAMIGGKQVENAITL
jgi:hypothetical protein